MRRASSALARGSGLSFLLAATLCSSPAWALSGPSPGAASAQTVKLPDGPASVRGLSDEASISVFSGQVGYSVPVDLPKGPAGFGPSLGLTYAGELGNGPLGIGWTIGSIAIRRSLRDGVPTYTDADQLEVTGIGASGRLIRIAPDEYRVEGEGNNLRIFRRNDRFEAVDADGVRYRLGSTEASREQDGSKIAAWFVDNVTNIAGQKAVFTYQKDQNEVYLSQIRWAPGDVYQVDLVYGGRRDRVVTYRAGFAKVCARRLDRLDVFTAFSANRSRLRSYQLTYDDQTFALSRLSSIRMFGTNSSQSLPELTFKYGRLEPAVVTPVAGTDGWVLNERGVSFADVDGDGADDLLRLEAGNHVFRLNQGGRFGDPVALSGANDIDLESSQFMDLDGDARPELVRIVDDTWRVYKLQGHTWTARGTWQGTKGIPFHDDATVLCDINGDGMTDVMTATGGGLLIKFNSPNGLQASRRLPRISSDDGTVEPGDPNVRFVDMNGDGVTDVVWLTDAWMKIFLGRGDGTFVRYDRIVYPWGQSAFGVQELQLADLNRDGLIDIVRISGGHIYWYPGEANGRFSTSVRHLDRPEGANLDAVVTIADANGNGSRDVVWSSPRGMWILDLTGPTSAGMLTEIDNGFGRTTRFQYASSAALAMTAEREGHPWTEKLPSNIPVVIRTDIEPGAGTPARVRHFGVRDGFWDASEHRMGGFLVGIEKTIDADGPVDTLVKETIYIKGSGADRVLRGREASVRLRNDNGTGFTATKTTWRTAAIADLDEENPLLRKPVVAFVETIHEEGLSSPLVTRTEFSELDGQGRATVEHQFGRTDRSGDEKVIRRTYADNDVLWVRNKIVEESTTEENGALVSAMRTYYGGRGGAPHALGEPAEGYVHRIDGFLDPSSRWVTQSTRQFDACGNPTLVTQNGVTRVLAYDTRCLRVTTETIASLSGATPMAWNLSWNEGLTQPVAMQDPNGDTVTVEYDTLGRQISVSLNGASPHVRYVYAWGTPFSKTTTWVFDGSPSALQTEGTTWPNGAHWRSNTLVSNGAGESLYRSTPLGARYLISEWTERDERGAPFRSAESFFSAVRFPVAPVVGTRVQVRDHDAQGRVRLQTLPNGAKTTTTYRALGQTVTADELGSVITELDGLSRIVHTERATGMSVETVDARYDAADRILAVSLQNGQAVHAFGYDTLGRLISAQDPDVGSRQLSYDDNGALIQHVNGEQQSLFFDYDGVGRLTRRGETAAPNAATDYSYIYDLASAAVSLDCRANGRLAAVTEPAGEVHFCYDELGRQTGVSRLISVPDAPPTGGSVARTFSLSGLVLSEMFDDGFSTAYKYDLAGRLIAVASDGTDLWVADGVDDLDATGRTRNERYGNGAVQSNDYDSLGLSAHIKVSQPSSATSLYEVTVTRNAYGAPKIITDVDGQGLDHNATFNYDAAGRLTAASLGAPGAGQFAFTYAYDALQNMTQRGVTGPQDIGVLKGTYRYGERGYGPRQLTSVIPGATP